MTQKLLISSILLVTALLVYFPLTQQFPISADDYSYLYQAKLFAAGKVFAKDAWYNPSFPGYKCVKTSCLKDDDGRRFSKYPPGWPILLAAGVWLGVPWLINPLLGALLVFLILTYTERRLGRDLVKITGLLLVLCFFFCYYSGSLRSHIATALFIFVAFLLYEVSERHPHFSNTYLFFAGAFLGYSSLIRYIDWIPLGLWIGGSLLWHKRWIRLICFVGGFAMLASGNLLYDMLISGDPFRVPAAFQRLPGFGDRLEISWSGFVVTIVRLADLLWAFPPAVLLILLWKRYDLSSTSKLCIGLFLMNAAIYFFYPAAVGGPGPRYLLAYFPFLILALVSLYQSIRQDPSPAVRYLWNIAIATEIVCSLGFASEEGYKMYWRRDLQRTTQQVGDEKKVFLLKTGTYATSIGDLTRNPPVLSEANNLYFSWGDESERAALLTRFPARKILVYEYPDKVYPYVLARDTDGKF